MLYPLTLFIFTVVSVLAWKAEKSCFGVPRVLPCRLTSVINPPVDVIASCVNCLSGLAARMPAKVAAVNSAILTLLNATVFVSFLSCPPSGLV